MSTNPYNDDKRLLELLERWQSGDFSRVQEQELQALADSDEFRRETVEGFWSLPETDHAAHLASLRERLRKRTGGGRIVAFPQILAAVAAISVLVLAVIWLIPSSEKSATMSQQAAQEPFENQPIASTLPEEKSAGPEMRSKDAPQLDRLGKSAQSKPASPMMDSPPAASGSASEVATLPPVLSAEETAGEKTDQIATSKPPANEAEYAKAKNEQDDVDQAPGSFAKRSESKKEAARAKDVQKQKPAAAAQNSQPVGGWSQFQDYLRRNARLPEAARQNNVSGSVRFKFRLDTSSQPIDFQITRSLGYGCDEEAVRLVKAYSWQRGSDPELTLEVSFVR